MEHGSNVKDIVNTTEPSRIQLAKLGNCPPLRCALGYPGYPVCLSGSSKLSSVAPFRLMDPLNPISAFDPLPRFVSVTGYCVTSD